MGVAPFPFLLLRADLLFHFPKCRCVLVSTELGHGDGGVFECFHTAERTSARLAPVCACRCG